MSEKKQTPAWVYPIAFIFTLALCGSCLYFFPQGESKELPADDLSGLTPLNQLQVTFDADDFNKRPITELKQKYGVPEAEYKNTPPAVSSIHWEKNSIRTQSIYPKADPKAYGVTLWIASEKCDPKSDFSEERIQRLFKIAGVSYSSSLMIEKTRPMLDIRYQIKGHSDWELISVGCGDTRESSISLSSHGYLNR